MRGKENAAGTLRVPAAFSLNLYFSAWPLFANRLPYPCLLRKAQGQSIFWW